MESWANSGLDLHLDLRGRGGLRSSLMATLREDIRSGRLAPGALLPPSRTLAADLGIARNTVADAYAELVAEGWLTARRGSGTRVAPRAAPAADLRTPRPAPPVRPAHNLMPGSPDAASFPRTAWLASTRRALTAAPSDAFGPGDPRGRPELRNALADYLARARGVRADPDRIVVCAGTAHALTLLAPLLGGAVAVEGHGLHVHRELLGSAGVRTVPLSVDSDGARVDELVRSGAAAALLTPAHQFPIGGPLHPERRAAAVDWASRSGGLILEDDYDGEFRYDRQPVGAMQDLDPERVVYLGSVSKSLSPALRLGWMALPDRLVDPVLEVKGIWERWVSVPDQLTLADFVDSGRYDRQIRLMRGRYHRRRDQLVATLADRAPAVRVTGIAAGLHAVLELPPGTETRALSAAAAEGLAVGALSTFRHPDARDAPRDGLVVGYGAPAEHAFAGALEALCRALVVSARIH
ncbi:PLP-dependent aminotransferase family protein [Rhodococcus sp. PvR099]|uniref:MocR-like pyridoxine biosynthesis transcription factor PdxR n=1 Tax=Rhodococcus sp. PvR099 TaxID=2806602 RepID=UPI001AE295BB|nr:PLP-dependent aminotransferase family protein [Rhodococcus sp. PvR099]